VRAVSGPLDVLAPPRLGVGFRRLLASSWTSNLADGIGLAAGPLLVASRTDDAFVVALAALLVWAPPLVFAIPAGAVTDRLDRRLVVVTGNLVRVAVLAVLTAAVATDRVGVAAVLVALFVLGTCEVFVDNTAQTLLPMLVHRDDLAIANARLQVGQVTLNQLAAPPLGALLFTLGHAVPFGAQAALVLLAAVVVGRLRLPEHRRTPEELRPVWHDVVEGFRWTWHHAAVRTLVLTIFVFNLTYGAAWSVLVLYVTEHLGLGDLGYGLVTSVIAAGGLVGTLSYGWLTRRFSLADLMRVGLVLETLTHLVLAATSRAYVALPVFFVFGAHAFVWGTTSITVRQRAVPMQLQGRVGSVNLVGMYGGLVIGAAIGGAIAQGYGVTAPFWFAFVGSVLCCVLIWRQLGHIAHADDRAAPLTEDASGTV
jgi:predicted MFS family arabinose efflux permease